MKKQLKQRVYLYRMEEVNKHGKQSKHLAEVRADCDENARRKIIHCSMSEGGHVRSIEWTEDTNKYPGESAKRIYR